MPTFIELLQFSPVFFISFAGVLGLMVGSFLNVVIHRMPRIIERDWQLQCAELLEHLGEKKFSGKIRSEHNKPYNLIVPRSACPHCNHKITALENIPLISYLLLRGKCRKCSKPISFRYPVIETVTGLLSAFAAWHFGYGLAAAGALIMVWALIALTVIDFETQLLPDDITLPLLWIGLLLNLIGTFTSPGNAIIGAAAGYLVLWSVYWLFKLLTGKEGMGYGDFKLLAALGAWMGWPMLPLIILLSSVVGALVGLALILFAKHGRDIPIPFGPYLAGGGLIALFWGPDILQRYLQLFAIP